MRREAFVNTGGFDESIGFIGEDTALIEQLLREGRVVYDPDVEVRHRRRAFPSAYLRQRFRYRVKTGRLLARGASAYIRNYKVLAFLGAGIAFPATTVIAPQIGLVLLGLYVLITTTLGIIYTRLSPLWWPLIPLAFGAHHATYFMGLLTGIAQGLLGRR